MRKVSNRLISALLAGTVGQKEKEHKSKDKEAIEALAYYLEEFDLQKIASEDKCFYWDRKDGELKHKYWLKEKR